MEARSCADVAKELTWSARVLSGSEAHELGLVTRLAEDPLAEAMELAEGGVTTPDCREGRCTACGLQACCDQATASICAKPGSAGLIPGKS